LIETPARCRFKKRDSGGAGAVKRRYEDQEEERLPPSASQRWFYSYIKKEKSPNSLVREERGPKPASGRSPASPQAPTHPKKKKKTPPKKKKPPPPNTPHPPTYGRKKKGQEKTATQKKQTVCGWFGGTSGGRGLRVSIVEPKAPRGADARDAFEIFEKKGSGFHPLMDKRLEKRNKEEEREGRQEDTGPRSERSISEKDLVHITRPHRKRGGLEKGEENADNRGNQEECKGLTLGPLEPT